MNEDMCTRQEVHDEIGRAVSVLKDTMREERDERMREIALVVLREQSDKTLRWVGIGGVIAVISFIYFYGQQTAQIDFLTQEVASITQSIEELDDFMNRGDRFTSADGLDLKQYSDEKDSILQTQIDRNHDEMRAWKDDIIQEIRAIR